MEKWKKNFGKTEKPRKKSKDRVNIFTEYDRRENSIKHEKKDSKKIGNDNLEDKLSRSLVLDQRMKNNLVAEMNSTTNSINKSLTKKGDKLKEKWKNYRDNNPTYVFWNIHEEEEGKFRWCFHHTPTKKLFLSKEIQELGEKWYEHEALKDKLYGQGIKRVQKEADAFLQNLGFTHDRENKIYKRAGEEKYKRVALFAHQGFGMAFMSAVMDIPYPYFCTHFDFGFSAVTVITFDDCEDVVIPKILQHSNDAHLYKAGLPLRYNHEFDF